MKKPLIAFDIDDVILDVTPVIFKKILKKWPAVDITNIYKYDIAECLNLDADVIYNLIYQTIRDNYFKLVKDCHLNILRLNKLFNIYLITSRNESLKLQTLDNIYGYFGNLFPPNKIIYTKEKWKVIKDLDIKFFVDDRVKYLEEIYTKTNCIPICFDKPWNQHCGIEITRVKNWNEIYTNIRM